MVEYYSKDNGRFTPIYAKYQELLFLNRFKMNVNNVLIPYFSD